MAGMDFDEPRMDEDETRRAHELLFGANLLQSGFLCLVRSLEKYRIEGAQRKYLIDLIQFRVEPYFDQVLEECF